MPPTKKQKKDARAGPSGARGTESAGTRGARTSAERAGQEVGAALEKIYDAVRVPRPSARPCELAAAATAALWRTDLYAALEKISATSVSLPESVSERPTVATITAADRTGEIVMRSVLEDAISQETLDSIRNKNAAFVEQLNVLLEYADRPRLQDVHAAVERKHVLEALACIGASAL